MITFIKDKDPIWEVENYDVVLVGTSIYSMLTNGFQSKIASKFPEVDEENTKSPYGDRRKLGTRLTNYNTKPIVSLLFICGYPHSKRVFLDYEALENCLALSNAEFKGKKVMMTIIGTTRFDGNGDREKVMEIIEKNTNNMDLYIYDYDQKDKKLERSEVTKKLCRENYGEYLKYKKAKDFKPYYKKFYLA